MKNTMKYILYSILLISLVASCSLSPSTPSGTAYIYGVSEYTTISSLSSTDNDARDMAELFSGAGYEVELRINDGSEEGIGEATVDQLVIDIEDFIDNAADNELFIFYFSGHGGRYDDIYYDVNAPSGLPAPEYEGEPDGADSADEWIFLYNSIPDYSYETWDGIALKDDDFADMLSDIPGNRKIVILDACNSGGFIGDSPIYDPVSPAYDDSGSAVFSGFTASVSQYFGFSKTAAEDIALGNAFVLTAAGEQESSWESGSNGVFTSAFLEAVLEGDHDENGYITLFEMYDYICESMDSWNSSNALKQFYPHLTGSAVDLVLFEASQ